MCKCLDNHCEWASDLNIQAITYFIYVIKVNSHSTTILCFSRIRFPVSFAHTKQISKDTFLDSKWHSIRELKPNQPDNIFHVSFCSKKLRTEWIRSIF